MPTGYSVKGFMNLYDDNQVFFIGSAQSYFFVGTKKDWADLHYEIEDQCYIATEQAYESAKANLFTQINEGIRKKRSGEKEDTYLQEATYRINVIHQAQQRYIRYKNFIRDYRPVEKRQVLEHYPRGQGDGIVIIVHGSEQGKFWSKEEFDRWRNQQKAG